MADTTKYELLFSPVSLPGGLSIRNRLFMPAMHVNLSANGMVNDEFVAFYRLRAKGGVGMISVGGCPVNSDAGGEFMIGINDDKYIPGLTRLTTAMKDEGAVTSVQLYHAGRYTYSFFLGGKAAPSASETTSPLTRERSRAMSVEEIQDTLRDFETCAARAAKAGFDTVEMLASAGYLVSQFLSPLTNHRTDEYGGSLENRMRFGIEVLKAMKKGSGLPVIVRLGGYDFVKGSTPQQDIIAFAKALADNGAELFNVTGGWHEANVPQITYHVPPAGMRHLGRMVKAAVGDKALVVSSNRLQNPDRAEEVLRHKSADMISLGRPLLTDPFWPQKVGEGRSDEVLPCISCNQACLDRIFEMKRVGCIVNPLTAEPDEATFDSLKSAQPKNIGIVGGGVAGLTAARLLARAGHTVTLYERDDRCGGQVLTCANSPHKDGFRTIVAPMATLARNAGANIRLNTPVAAETLKLAGHDAVVLATGADQAIPPIPGIDLPHVTGSHEFLRDDPPAGPDIVVIGAGPSGVEAALKAATRDAMTGDALRFLMEFEAYNPQELQAMIFDHNARVTLVEMDAKIGNGIGRSTKWVAKSLLEKYNVATHTGTKVMQITDSEVVAEHQGVALRIPADTVIISTGMRSRDELAEALDGSGMQIMRIGDAQRPGDIEKATADALKLTRSLM